ncbi:MAG: hypothetical protein WB791_09570 [Waddliaceae bacterium]
MINLAGLVNNYCPMSSFSLSDEQIEAIRYRLQFAVHVISALGAFLSCGGVVFSLLTLNVVLLAKSAALLLGLATLFGFGIGHRPIKKVILEPFPFEIPLRDINVAKPLGPLPDDAGIFGILAHALRMNSPVAADLNKVLNKIAEKQDLSGLRSNERDAFYQRQADKLLAVEYALRPETFPDWQDDAKQSLIEDLSTGSYGSCVEGFSHRIDTAYNVVCSLANREGTAAQKGAVMPPFSVDEPDEQQQLIDFTAELHKFVDDLALTASREVVQVIAKEVNHLQNSAHVFSYVYQVLKHNKLLGMVENINYSDFWAPTIIGDFDRLTCQLFHQRFNARIVLNKVDQAMRDGDIPVHLRTITNILRTLGDPNKLYSEDINDIFVTEGLYLPKKSLAPILWLFGILKETKH